MRIALLHPTYWPEVRRGSERLIHDLAATLAGRGHDVTLLTTHPGPASTTTEDGFTVVRSRRIPQPPTLGLHEDFLGNVPEAGWRLARGSFDLAHAFHLAPGWAAVKARRFGGPPVVFSFHGTPFRSHLVARRYRLEMMQSVVAGAAAVSVLSEAAADPFRRYLLREPRILPGGVLTGEFAVDRPRAERPTLLSAASLGDPRKRGELLLDGFRILRERVPDARLEVARTPDPHLSPYRFELPEGASWIEPGSTAELARAYAGAHASVLAARDEAFGLVLVESLAAGTPAVAAASGASGEILDRDGIGARFEGDSPDALAGALARGLELGADPETAARCRDRAAEFDWDRVADLYEDAYEEARGARAPAA
ncbi:MAG TPA: glycosyltransferase family 4 protein [Solirubrobacterales bacterium]